MAHGIIETSHAWLVMLKAMRALARYAAAGIEGTGLGESDFRVLEVVLHKGPLPVNTIGPIVDLTPGSISIAVDRLFAKGLVSRVESAEDRRVRIVALTPRGKDLIVSAFRKHSGQMKRVSMLLLGANVALYGQQIAGSIVGNVTDASGSAVPEAQITVKNEGTGIEFKTR